MDLSAPTADMLSRVAAKVTPPYVCHDRPRTLADAIDNLMRTPALSAALLHRECWASTDELGYENLRRLRGDLFKCDLGQLLCLVLGSDLGTNPQTYMDVVIALRGAMEDAARDDTAVHEMVATS